jgi:acetylornithine/N-succinyldiaminopimelate aminotransferase
MDPNEIMALDKKYVMNTYARLPVVFTRGEGVYLWDESGKRYLDFIGGIGVAGVGHANPKVAAAICGQAKTLLHTSNLFYTAQQAELAKALIDISFPGKVFFANSGAEANEAAIKAARKYAGESGKAGHTVVSALGSFHGRTLATLAATGQPAKHEPFKPMPSGFTHVPFNDSAALESAARQDACAIMLEPVQGEGGIRIASAEFMKTARRLCDENGLLLIADEVQSGLGRTGNMFAYEHYGIVPDIVTVSKSLGGGVPIGAAIFNNKSAGALGPGDHGTTFGGSPIACAAALAVLNEIKDRGLVKNALEMGAILNEKLVEIMDASDMVVEVRALGLMAAIELKQPVAAKVLTDCLKQGLVINRTSDTTIRFLPPLVVKEEEISIMAGILTGVLEEL